MVGKCFMYCGDKIGYQPRFRDVGETSLGEASAHKCRVLMNSQENKLGLGSHFVKLTCGFNSGKERHRDVQYNHIWLKPLSFADQGPSVMDNPDHFKVRLQKGLNTFEYEMMVVGKEDPWPRQDLPLFLRNSEARTMQLHGPCFR